MLYATSRERTGTSDPRRFYGPRTGTRDVGVARVRLPHDPRMGERETGEPVQRSTLVAVEPGPPPSLEGQDVLVFVHGFNVSFPSAARRAARLAYDLDFEGRVAAFSWPSAATYGGDEVRVLRAAVVLREWLDELGERADTVHIVAHAMGARAVVHALRALVIDETPSRFGEVVLVVPDIDADEFVDEIAPNIARFADRVTVYASANARVLHHDLEAEALGDTENGLALSEHFETVDASAVGTNLMGHIYGDERRSVVSDLANLLAGREREGLLEQRIGRTVYWTMEGPPIRGTL